jgi:ABC-2 type transport system ATP-binding protein
MNRTHQPDEPAVRVESLTMKFDSFTAVDSVSFDVANGEIFGFLGPNGAGKSTTIRMLCGILKPTGGSGMVRGYSIAREQENIKMITGYMSQKFSLYDDLTPVENLEFFSGVYGLRGGERRDRVEWALTTSDLLDRRGDLAGNLAAGLKQRLALSAAILHKPSILFLDEPTAGIDPLSRRNFWDLIYEMSSAGVTVFVTTHYMDEAEHCDRVAFINRGRLIDLDTPTNLKNAGVRGIVYEFAVSDWHRGFDLLRSRQDEFGEVSLFGTNIHLDFVGEDIQSVGSFLAREGIKTVSLRKISPSLEDAFVALLRPEDTEAVER